MSDARDDADVLAKWLACHDDGWKAWRFKEDLRLMPVAEHSAPAGSHRDSDTIEEGVETLLMLNLDRLFPHLSLRLTEKGLGGWKGCDIGALDPTGRRHVFEVKHGAQSRNVVDQVIAYGFQGLTRRSIRCFDEQGDQRLVAAARIAGFWNGDRVQTYTLSDEEKNLPPSKRQEAMLDALADEQTSSDEWLAAADRALEELQPSAAWLRNANSPGFGIAGVHLHIVVPYAKSIDTAARESLERMVSRGVHSTIWEAAISVDSRKAGSREGALWLRPVEILAADQTGSGEEDEPVDDSEERQGIVERRKWAVSAAALLCQMSLQDAGLEVLRHKWIHRPGDDECLTLAWEEDQHRQGLKFLLRVVGDEVTCEVRTWKPSWIWHHKERQTEYRDRVRKRRKYIARWLAAVVDFEEAQPGVDPMEWLNVGSQTWHYDGTWPRASAGNLPVRAYHPGGMFAASFTVHLAECGLKKTAAVCADALVQFSEIAGLACYDNHAFGPFEEAKEE